MATAQLTMTGAAESARATSRADLEAAVTAVRVRATEFARLDPAAKARLLRASLDTLAAVAPGWVAAACKAKGLDLDGPASSEEWLAGPAITIRCARLMAESLETVARQGRPPLGRGLRTRPDGRLEVDVFPASAIDSAAYAGYRGAVLLEADVSAEQARERQAEFYQRHRPEGSVCAILGAGNVAAIPPTDVFWKLFAEGRACVLKMNPVNEYLGPFLEGGLRPLIDAGCLRIVYGGAAEGAFLVEHPAVDDVHITGSAVTFDAIVWGPPGPERERRLRDDEPVLKKSISSELGNVSPVIVVPGAYSDRELRFQARAVASSVVNNGSFNCNASKMLVVAAGWPQRERFAQLIVEALDEAPTRRAYYPGAANRYESLLAGHTARRAGKPGPDALAWAFVPDLDPEDRGEKLFGTEPFCGLLSETALRESDPAAFLAAATAFCNERLWGTLSAEIITPRDGDLEPAVEAGVRDLRYGTVAVNVWPAVSYAVMTPPWGGHPSSGRRDIQSGQGWVHNTYLLGGVDKAVLRAPLVPQLKPAWHFDHRTAHVVAHKLVDLERRPSLGRLAGVAATALRG